MAASKKEAPLAAITNGKLVQFELRPGELQAVLNNLGVLKDFEHTSLEVLRILQKNYRKVKDFIEPISDDESTIVQELQRLSSPIVKDKYSPEELEDRRIYASETYKKFLNTPLSIELYTVSINDFPIERDKFTTKTVQTQTGPREVNYVSAFIELTDTIIR